MNTETLAKEGFISFRDYNVWYRTVGNCEESGKLPLLCLHGGPGAPHDYLELWRQWLGLDAASFSTTNWVAATQTSRQTHQSTRWLSILRKSTLFAEPSD